MLNYNVRFTEEPALCLTSALPDGTYDVWLRKNIGSEIKTDDNGDEYTEYYAEQEAYARMDEPFTLLPGDPGYNQAYEAVAAWEPSRSGDGGDELALLKQRVDSLAASNDMLAECILEMSEIIYA